MEGEDSPRICFPSQLKIYSDPKAGGMGALGHQGTEEAGRSPGAAGALEWWEAGIWQRPAGQAWLAEGRGVGWGPCPQTG